MNPRIPYRMSSERPPLPPLDGKHLIVQFVINVEYWPFDRPMPRTVLPAPHGGEATPDVPNFSWVDYGMRCGLPRLLDVLSDVPVTVAMNASVLDAYPSAAQALHARGWEFIGHGLDQVAMHGVQDEAETVRAALDRLEQLTGRRPIGWLGPGLQETDNTPEVLSDAGIKYVLDWVIDDLPSWIQIAHGRRLASLPYSLELNDSLLHAVQQQPSDELLRRLERTLTTFEREIADGQCRVLTVPLHPHLMGVPHRIGVLREVVAFLTRRDDTVVVDGQRLYEWFASVAPPEHADG
jgi:allantoinase